MKKECAIVQDLLVLYEDDVLREQSKQMVEEHIRGCEECMQAYENARKELPVIEPVTESSEAKQEDAAVRIMKKLEKKITYRTGGILAAVVAAVCIAIIIVNGICDRLTDGWGGIAAVISTIPTENFHIAELYQLKNGDIYCALESDKGICTRAIADWVIPTGEEYESTEDAVKELRFKYEPWELNAVRANQQRMILTMVRQGTVEESGKTITQRCSEISIYGKTKKDKLTIWKAGQKVKAAPESIEEEAIRAYVQEGLLVKAMEECDQMGWDEYEKIFGDAQPGLTWRTESGSSDMGVTFTSEEDSILLYNIPEIVDTEHF